MVTSAVVPQPLTGKEIRIGIASRMTKELPEDSRDAIRESIESGLMKTCSLIDGSAYSRFSADWTMTWWKDGDTPRANWWVDGKLDDFGRVTPVCIGFNGYDDGKDAESIAGHIGEVPPDRFRRETDQPIPKPMELKKQEEPTQTFSKSMRGPGKRRDV